ncbi:MAG TPA: dTMP kinase [Phycisphaerales bacterium]|nr:dTMP kinase [Phycisphaerales bacterium]HRQ74312.1 dTMP kinase [Phycisphaerales bacterium]
MQHVLEHMDQVEEAGFRSNGNAASVDQARPTGAAPLDISRMPGRLIVVEGTDGAGRSTQIALLREWLEARGFGVAHTALTRSRLVGEGLKKAKEGHTLGRITMDLLYATDLADRLENQILPALRAGFVVLTDRYVYSAMARSIVRGGSPAWIEHVYRFAPSPHAVFYLDIDVPHLTPRVLARGGFDYWESGLDLLEENDTYRAFVTYQTRVLSIFSRLAQTYNFTSIDARRSVRDVFLDLSAGVLSVVSSMQGAKL